MARQTDSKLRVNVEEQLERLVKQLEDLENYKQVPFIFKNWQSNMFYSSFIFFVEKKGRDKLEWSATAGPINKPGFFPVS